ncbi:glycosyltransferase family 2 protein [Nocardioides sp. BGMRC 2183]|nr:glycosyltransferase family 2 protein [Nocardioides sp. BGMRC 2183]
MSSTDLTLVVTVHDETAVCGPTMQSAEAAIAAARAAGLDVQQIVALDRATDATRAYFQQTRFDQWDRRSFDVGDLGKVRNAVLPQTDGRYVAFLDADDLFSENWLASGVAYLQDREARSETAIAHPELNVIFDAEQSVLVNIDQDSPLFTPHQLYLRNPYDALCIAAREAFLDVPYRPNDIAAGLAFEDWTWGIETMSRGWRHVVVPDTIIFKRRRDSSLVTASSARRAVVRSLPEMAIDRVRDLGGRG